MEANENDSKANNGNIVQDFSSSPEQRKAFVNNNNININNNKNLNNNNANANANENADDNVKNGSLTKNDKFRFGSTKTLSREDDRILKEMVSYQNHSFFFHLFKMDAAILIVDYYLTFTDFPICDGNTNERFGQILS